MSFENERRRRINTIMEQIEKSGRGGIVPQLLYQKVAPEITKERLFIHKVVSHRGDIKLTLALETIFMKQISILKSFNGVA